MDMAPCRLRRMALLLLVAAVVGALSLPAQACVDSRSYAYGPEQPFGEYYFEGAAAAFRGRPLEYRSPDGEAQNDFFISTEITFEVLETYLGEEREVWTVLWFRTVYDPDSLQAFRKAAGDDLVVAIGLPNEDTNIVTQLPQIRLGILCEQPAMSSFSAMEPVLRKRGLID